MICARWDDCRKRRSRCKRHWMKMIASENWKNAAIDASNLSELYLTIGDLPQALTFAQQSVELADHSGEEFQRMSKRTTLADALHQAGRPRKPPPPSARQKRCKSKAA